MRRWPVFSVFLSVLFGLFPSALPAAYTTNQLVIEIRPDQVRSEVKTKAGQLVEACLGYPPAPGKPEACD